MASTAVQPAAHTLVCGEACVTCRGLREAAARLAAENGIDTVTAEGLADAAGLQPSQLALHRDGAPHTCVGHAYLEASDRLRQVWATTFAGCDTWFGGLRAAMGDLLKALAADEVTARLCFVEVPHGDRELLQLREGVRRRNVEILCQQYEAHHPGAPVPEIHIELVYGTILHSLAQAVEHDRIGVLVDRVDEVLAVAGG